ncbi:MAG: winged helix-turn-helix domain-containing protein [Ktedonobacterales bacterium]
MWGFVGEVWTCRRVAEVIRRTFGVNYHRAHVYKLLLRFEQRCSAPLSSCRGPRPQNASTQKCARCRW